MRSKASDSWIENGDLRNLFKKIAHRYGSVG